MKRVRAGDILLAALIAATAVCLLFLFPKTQGARADIYRDGTLYASYLLSDIEDTVILTVEGKYTSVIELSGEGARFASSDCPERACVHAGLISRGGEMAACVPNRVLITISGETAYDAVAR